MGKRLVPSSSGSNSLPGGLRGCQTTLSTFEPSTSKDLKFEAPHMQLHSLQHCNFSLQLHPSPV
eukprot:scaffold31183_cov31-Tisochrysis_lutea.AAC.7